MGNSGGGGVRVRGDGCVRWWDLVVRSLVIRHLAQFLGTRSCARVCADLDVYFVCFCASCMCAAELALAQ